MRERSFYDILTDKIKRDEQRDKPLNEPSLEYFKFSLNQPLPFFEDLKPAPKPTPAKAVPPPISKEDFRIFKIEKPQKSAPTPVVETENWIYKKDLTVQAQKAWDHFEKMLDANFNGKTSRRLAMGAFRKFIKNIHPDLAKSSSKHNFSDYVKIKDEFIRHIS